MSESELPEDARRRYHQPYTDKRKIPTISKYREEQQSRQERAKAFEHRQDAEKENQSPSPHNARLGAQDHEDAAQGARRDDGEGAEDEGLRDTSEATAGSTDPRQRMKERKAKRDEAAEREVTDPVTHLPVRIRDYTDEVLKEVPENPQHYGSTVRTATGLSNKSKGSKELEDEVRHLRKEREEMQALFPPPDFDAIKLELASIHKLGVTVGLVGTVVAMLLVGVVDRLLGAGVVQQHLPNEQSGWLFLLVKWLILGAVGAGVITALVLGVRDWMAKRIDAAWENEVWAANKEDQKAGRSGRDAESVAWLNSLLAAVWPLVNPDLFTSLADTLEDVMQASLPKMVRMVSVDDIGQGSESVQILGVKWLPTGAAAQSVTEDGDLKGKNNTHSNRKDSGNDSHANGKAEEAKGASEENEETQHRTDDDQQEDGTQQPVAQGLEAEEGDFVNVEIAFAYRARSKAKSWKDRAKDAHVYLAFYLPGNIKVPVWVDLVGLVGSMRLRLQLAPDPPFFAMATLTFLGQPKVSMSCVPLSKYALNIMDVPLISNFVQGAVDAAMAQYVAPKSLNLDLKDMLAGDDFKKDTTAHGVLVINIKRGYDFKEGDSGIPLLRDGSSDPYVSVGWAKFGKPVWSTRLLLNEMEPYWDETCYVLVTQQELNVAERIRVQLWDSDRMSADDDLGRIEVNLKELMRREESRSKMWQRSDGFRALKAGEQMPGKLEWSVGYYPKTRIQNDQLEKQTFDNHVRSLEQLQKKVDDICARKLREASIKAGHHSDDGQELEQQKIQELKDREDSMIISAPPPDGYPSGIFSIQIHQITGLELAKLSKDADAENAEASDEEEQGDGLPSAYCNVIINHKKVFRTRTKPTNAKPFYNAGTERFIGDWRAAEVHVAVRDARVKEDDALLGIVHLPLAEVFKERAQVNGFYPLVGGVGYGRVRISMVWRSVQLQAPREALGWEHGTLEISPSVKASNLPPDLKKTKVKFSTSFAKGKMYPSSSSGENDAQWTPRISSKSKDSSKSNQHTSNSQRPLHLGVRTRYSTPLTLTFQNSSSTLFNKDPNKKISAYAIFWLKDLPDEERRTLTLPVYQGGDFERASKCCLPPEQMGEKVGSVEVEVCFFAGLGRAHGKWAKKDRNVRNVVEVLATARDNLEEAREEEEAGIVSESGSARGNSPSSDSDSSSSEDHETNDESSNSDSPPHRLKKTASDFKKHQQSLGRRHRGIMQWRLPRTAKWGVGKVHDVEGKFRGMFRHGEGQGGGVETEV